MLTTEAGTNKVVCPCPYCAVPALRKTHTALYHPRKTDHGPFEFYECANCGSGVTFPMPSTESLIALYQSFNNGLNPENREAMGDDDGELWHATCVKKIAALGHFTKLSRFTWIDIGAGAGEMPRRMASAFPNSSGLAVDLHSRPAGLPSNAEWLQVDLNQPDFHKGIERKADVVYATAVWEHVKSPDAFAQNIVHLLNEGGLLYLVCPNYDSPARKILGTKWPYFTPGEHLSMPSPKGAESCLQRSFATAGLTAKHTASRPVLLTYSLTYTARRFRLPFADLIPRFLRMPMPAGGLEAVAIRSSKLNISQ